MRLLAAFTVALAALLAAPLPSGLPAMASCVAPTVTFKPARIARGSVVTITGKYFGDGCSDSGTVPQGLGPLGNPMSGLAIVIDQGSNEFLMATGSAGSDYAFQVDVVVPNGLEPGDASIIVVAAGDARLPADRALVISDAPPTGAAEATVATFGPTTTTGDTQPQGSAPLPVLPADIPDEQTTTVAPLSTAPAGDDSNIGDQRLAIGIGIVAALAIGVTGFAVWSRSKRG